MWQGMELDDLQSPFLPKLFCDDLWVLVSKCVMSLPQRSLLGALPKSPTQQLRDAEAQPPWGEGHKETLQHMGHCWGAVPMAFVRIPTGSCQVPGLPAVPDPLLLPPQLLLKFVT